MGGIRHWSIRTRLVVAFVGVLIPYLALAGIGVVGIRAISETVWAMYAEATIEQRKISDLEIALDRLGDSVEDYLVAGRSTERAQLELHLARFHEVLARLEPTLFQEAEERQLVMAMRSQGAQIESLGQEILAATVARVDPSALAKMKALHQRIDQASETLNRAQAISTREMGEELGRVSGMIRRTLVAGLAALFLSAAGGVTLALLTSTWLSRPILAIAEASRRIAEGDLSQRVGATAGGELGEVAQAFNQMGERLKAAAIEKARLIAATERAARELRSPYEVAHSLATSLCSAKVLHLIAVKTTELLDTPHAHVVLWDEDTKTLRLGAAHGTEAEKIKSQQFRLGEGVNGIVAQTRAPLIVNDYQAFPHRVPGFTELVAVIGVPLLYRDRFLGVLTSHATQPGAAFTQTHLALLTSFADQAAVALENARLYEETQQQAATLEVRVRERTAELEEALRVKAQFLANMSHELRTPLNAVLGFSEVLLGRGSGDLTAKQERYLQQIQSGGQRLLTLVNDLLELAESQTGLADFRVDRLAVNDLVAEVLAPLAVAATAKQVEVATDFDPGLPTVVAGRRKLAQVLHHLVTNAVRFTPTGGRVTVRTRRIGTPAGEEAEFMVVDTGIGIRTENLERIFRGFEQVDASDSRQYGGAGLGLALVRHLVRLHGGRVWAESDGEGHGARFMVRLPLLVAPPAPRVLVVEDEEPVLEAICATLAAAGYLVDRARTGAEALDRLATTPPSLLVLDIGLPDADGWEVLKQVRREEQTRTLPVLVLTGLQHVHAEEALARGADEFLAKPVSAQVLVETVGRLLRQPAAAARALEERPPMSKSE